MKSIFKLTFFICLVCHIISGMAQTRVSYVYDSAGNRVSRTIVLTRVMNPEEDYFVRETMKESTVKIYPSETNVKVVIENYSEDFPIRYFLYNVQGALLQSNINVNPTFTLDMAGYSTGTYVLKIIIGDYSSNWKFLRK
ncbi:MAG: T9SS type A sorting domain-containing protein [Bacteroidaceae bacterium]|nr:T9SS type A sorting domain-containing protein [Bacteroidaceae bacterium]